MLEESYLSCRSLLVYKISFSFTEDTTLAVLLAE